MRNAIIKGFLVLFALWMGGCGSGSLETQNNTTIMASDNTGTSGVKTLSLEELDVEQFLIENSWQKIAIDLSIFYANDNYPKKQDYRIDLHFKKREVVAYADCQKIIARYEIRDQEISFSHLSIAPALELATCEEEEYADSALWAFLENRFLVKEVTKKSVVFDAIDVESEVVLSQE